MPASQHCFYFFNLGWLGEGSVAEPDFLAGAGENTPTPGHYLKINIFSKLFFSPSYDNYLIFFKYSKFYKKLKETIVTLLKK